MGSLRRHLVALACVVLLVAGLGIEPVAAETPPVDGDDHTNPLSFGPDGYADVRTDGATFTATAPETCGPDDPDVWLAFELPARRAAQLRVVSTSGWAPTTVAVVAAPEGGGYDELVCNQSSNAMEFQGEAVTHLVRVATKWPIGVRLQLVVHDAPANDDRAAAEDLTLLPAAGPATTSVWIESGDAIPVGTRAPDDPACGPADAATTWHRFVATSDASVVTLHSRRDGWLGLYRAAGDGLVPIACVDATYTGQPERVRAATVPGATYYAMAVLDRSVYASAELRVEAAAAQRAPDDAFADAAPLGEVSSTPVTVPIATHLTTREEHEPVSSCQYGGTRWATFTAPARGTVQARLVQASLDRSIARVEYGSQLALAAFAGGELATLRELACDGFDGGRAEVVVPVDEGTTFSIAVGGESAFDDDLATLEVWWVGPSPANDDLAAAAPLTLVPGETIQVTGDTTGATPEPADPHDCGEDWYGSYGAGYPVWYSFSAPSSGALRVGTDEEGDTERRLLSAEIDGTDTFAEFSSGGEGVSLTVNGETYGDPAPPPPPVPHAVAVVDATDMEVVACLDSGWDDFVDIAGSTPYLLAVRAYAAERYGAFSFPVRYDPTPANDLPGDAVPITLSTTPTLVEGSTAGATRAGDDVGCHYNGGLVWYRVGVPIEANVVVEYAGPTDRAFVIAPRQLDGAIAGRDSCILLDDDDARAVIPSQAGAEVLIGVLSYWSDFSMQLSLAPRPVNDEPAGAISLAPDGRTTVTGDFAGATGDTSDCWWGRPVASVWYAVEPARTAIAAIDTLPSYEAAFSVFRDTGESMVPVVACDQWGTEVEMLAGERYLIAVMEYSEIDEPYELTVDLLPNPANDGVEDAAPLLMGPNSGTTVGATSDGAGLPACGSGPSPRTVWYRLDPLAPGVVAFSITPGTHQVRVLRITPGADPSRVGCYSADANHVTVEPGSTYLFGVEQPSGPASAFELVAALSPLAGGAGVSVSDATVVEGAGSATFTVALDRASLVPVEVTYSTADGTAVEGVDVDATTGTLTFLPGQRSKTVAVPLVDDDLDENEEWFSLEIDDVVGGHARDGSGHGTILDDDEPPAVSIDDASVVEGSQVAALTVALSAPSGNDVLVAYRTASGTATSGEDFDSRTGVVRIPAGATTATVLVPIVADRRPEATETFTVVLDNPTAATIGRSTATVAIVDDDGRSRR